ncbi:hypothetical protein ABIB17_000473 [Arthrobacter sp. UYEF6]
MDRDAIVARFFNKEGGAVWAYSESECFLCLTPLTPDNLTREHIFPKWLLKRHHLWDKSMTLMNGTLIKYRQLTIPCCLECNGTHLSQMENEVRTAFDAGYQAVKEMNRNVLFSWLAKIFYGLLVKERHSLLDLRNQSGDKILGDDDLNRFAMHHLLMQTVRGDVNWHSPNGENPWSIFVLECQTSDEEPSLNFDYIDENTIPFLAIRSGDVAVVASLQDWGYLENSLALKHMVAAQQLKLHPFQFKEIALVSCYASLVFFENRRFVLAVGEQQTAILPLPLPSPIAMNIEDPQLLYLAPTLAMHLQTPLDHVTDGKRVLTTLAEPDGTPWVLDWDGTSNFPMLTIHGLDTDPTRLP